MTLLPQNGKLFVLQMPLRRCSLISLYLLLCPRVFVSVLLPMYSALHMPFPFVMCALYLTERTIHFFTQHILSCLLLSSPQHCILDRCKLKFLVPNVVNIKAVLSTRVLSFFFLPHLLFSPPWFQ